MEFNPNDLIVTDKPKKRISSKRVIKKKSRKHHENILINFLFTAREAVKANILNFFQSKYIKKY